jgi:hypothetical protein
VLLLNAAFLPVRRQIGLVLHEGIGELDASTVYDAHAAAGVAEVHAVALERNLVRTAHDLWLEPAIVVRDDPAKAARLDRMIVPGRDGRDRFAALERALGRAGAAPVEYLHAEDADRFSLEPTLEDLARNEDVTTARFARRRLEYRSSRLRLEGRAMPVEALSTVLVFLLSNVALFTALAHRVGGRRSRRTGAASSPAPPPGAIAPSGG